ncbi:PP2Cc like protein phosphatase [Cryptosporidium canis]|uniref:PP2Cc like protein phosphatase n=1 Tax=Cryptosporidium canis TaxID=195482 RepID=A0A9D5HUP7_9CRYT|nr:PP2Cc like protein phosphatase [Cryptosporidium canis]
MKFKIFTRSRSSSRILTPRLIEEGFFDIYKNELFNGQVLTIDAILDSDYYDSESSWSDDNLELKSKIEELSDSEDGSDKISLDVSISSKNKGDSNDSQPGLDGELYSKSKDEKNTDNIIKYDLVNYKDLLSKLDSGSFSDNIQTEREDEINQLRNSIFKKLDSLQHEIVNIRSRNQKSVTLLALDRIWSKNNLEFNIHDILSSIGKHFIQGVNSIIEVGNSTIFKKHSLELSDIRNILQEYNNSEISYILSRMENQHNISDFYNFNNHSLGGIFQTDAPIKGIGCWSEQGLKYQMDDRWFISKLTKGFFFGILDAYNNDRVSSELERLIVEEFDINVDNEASLNKNNVAKIFLKTILSIDQRILSNSAIDSLNSGSGLISCFIFHSESANMNVLFSCSLGECRGFLSRNNEILKFTNTKDCNLIGMTPKYGIYQDISIVNSAIGFGFFKPPFKSDFQISNVPQVISIDLISNEDKFIVLATDSIWQVLQEEEVNEIILCILKELNEKFPILNKQTISTILSHSIITESLIRGGIDNQICMVALLD